jgi:hypothetical protein
MRHPAFVGAICLVRDITFSSRSIYQKHSLLFDEGRGGIKLQSGKFSGILHHDEPYVKLFI